MVFKNTKIMQILLACLVLSQCGTDVDVGANDEQNGNLPGMDSASGEGNPNAKSADGSGSGFGLTCFGEVPELPDFLNDFCASLSDAQKESHTKALEDICEKKRFANLFANGCSWLGSKPQEHYFNVLEHTPLSDEGSDFSYYGAFSLTISLGKADTLGLIFRAIADPNYGDKFYTLPNTRISNAVVGPDKSWVTYTAENWNSSSVARFDGRMDVAEFPGGLTVLFDRAVGNMSLVSKSRLLVMLIEIDDEHTRAVYVDEKELRDGGLHDLAIRAVVKADMDRMFNSYHNALIEKGDEVKP